MCDLFPVNIGKTVSVVVIVISSAEVHSPELVHLRRETSVKFGTNSDPELSGQCPVRSIQSASKHAERNELIICSEVSLLETSEILRPLMVPFSCLRSP